MPLHDVEAGNTKRHQCEVPPSLQTKYIERYIRQILAPFVESFSDEGWDYSFFKQESATAHTSHNSMPALRIVFSDRIISSPLWSTPGTLSSSICSFYRFCRTENGLSQVETCHSHRHITLLSKYSCFGWHKISMLYNHSITVCHI